MKYLISIIFVVVMAAAASAQEIMKNDRKVVLQPGTLSGEIVIQNAIGSGLSKFTCGNLIVSASKLGGGWQRKSRASGDFTRRRCVFALPPIPAGESFVAAVNAQMPSCDQKSFETTTSFPMKLKPGEALKYNFTVTKISCVLLK